MEELSTFRLQCAELALQFEFLGISFLHRLFKAGFHSDTIATKLLPYMKVYISRNFHKVIHMERVGLQTYVFHKVMRYTKNMFSWIKRKDKFVISDHRTTCGHKVSGLPVDPFIRSICTADELKSKVTEIVNRRIGKENQNHMEIIIDIDDEIFFKELYNILKQYCNLLVTTDYHGSLNSNNLVVLPIKEVFSLEWMVVIFITSSKTPQLYHPVALTRTTCELHIFCIDSDQQSIFQENTL